MLSSALLIFNHVIPLSLLNPHPTPAIRTIFNSGIRLKLLLVMPEYREALLEV